MRGTISTLISQGKTHDEIIQYHISTYGSQEPLASPIDKGFNRLAWLFPYLVGGTAAVAGAFMLRKWSHGALEPLPAGPAMTEDPALLARLDRELEDLD